MNHSLKRTLLAVARLIPENIGEGAVRLTRRWPPSYKRYAAALLGNAYLMARPRCSQSFSVEGWRFVVDTGDVVGRYITLFGTWEPAITSVFRERCTSSGVAIDVGANIGYYTRLFSHGSEESRRVVSYEADPTICTALRDTVSHSGRGDCVTVRQVAVSDTVGHADFFTAPVGNRGHGSLVADVTHSGSDLVVCTTLDTDLVELGISGESVALVKIDVEGAEREVLAGGRNTFGAMLPGAKILLEVAHQDELNSLLSSLPGRYEVEVIPNDYTVRWYALGFSQSRSNMRSDGKLDVLLTKVE